MAGRVASFHREAHVWLAEFTSAPRVGRTSTQRGSAHRLDLIEEVEGIGTLEEAFPSLTVPGGECLTFLHYFSGLVELGLDEAISAAAARRGIKVRVTNRDILRDGTDIACGRAFLFGFHGRFERPISTVSTQVFLVLPSAAPGFGRVAPPPVRDRQYLDVYRRVERRSWKRRKEQWFVLSRGLRCTATLENPADPGVDPYPSAWLFPALASIIVEPDALRAIYNICCFGPLHWKEQCWVGFLPGLEAFEKRCCCKVPHVALSSRAANPTRDVVPATALRRICQLLVGRHDKPPRWWHAAAKPDFVLGCQPGSQLDAVFGTASTRRSATTQMRPDSLGCMGKLISRVHRWSLSRRFEEQFKKSSPWNQS